MCRAAKPYTSEDIYELHGKDEKYSSNTSLSGLAAAACENKPKRGKWSCETCTFLNPSREQVSFLNGIFCCALTFYFFCV